MCTKVKAAKFVEQLCEDVVGRCDENEEVCGQEEARTLVVRSIRKYRDEIIADASGHEAKVEEAVDAS